MSFKIAIDGPAGAGKSSIAKATAKELGFIYVDTGALYRAVAYYVLNAGKSAKIESDVVPMLRDLIVELKFVNGEQRVFVNHEDVTDKIRSPEVSMGASDVSAIPAVREFLFKLQRSIALENNVIMDGRDIGTVVLPDAELKIFLTASPEERAMRRYRELKGKSNCPSFEKILEDIKIRDNNDSQRKTAPLKQAEDAVLIDTTEMSFERSIEKVKKLISEKL